MKLHNFMAPKLPEKIKRGLFIWIGSILFFVTLIFAAEGDFSTSSQIYLILLLVDVLIGIFAFIALFFEILRHKLWDLLIIVIFISLSFFVILPKLPNKEHGNKQNRQLSAVDPYVDCPINEKCGGGTKRLRQSECLNSVCCEIGEVWIVMDRDQCTLKQQEYARSRQPVHTQRIIQIPSPPKLNFPRIPTIKPPELPLCCKETCNSFTGVCTTRCERSLFCF